MTGVGRPDCLFFLRLYKYGRPARAILGKQGGGKIQRFFWLNWGRWRLLCLQCKCAGSGYLQLLQQIRIDRFVADAMPER